MIRRTSYQNDDILDTQRKAIKLIICLTNFPVEMHVFHISSIHVEKLIAFCSLYLRMPITGYSRLNTENIMFCFNVKIANDAKDFTSTSKEKHFLQIVE